MPPVLPTGCPTRTSCPATTAAVSSLPSCPSTTAAPVAKECAMTARQSDGPCPRGAGTTLCACARAATRNRGTFNTDRLPSAQPRREAPAQSARSLSLLYLRSSHGAVSSAEGSSLCINAVAVWGVTAFLWPCRAART